MSQAPNIDIEGSDQKLSHSRIGELFMVGVRQLKAAVFVILSVWVAAFAPPSSDVERWQAIAVRDDFRVFGMSQVNNMPSKEAAIAQAMHNCVTNHGGTCRVLAVTYRCATVAYNEGELSFFSATGDNETEATLNARNYCASNGQYCDKKLTACPWPMPK